MTSAGSAYLCLCVLLATLVLSGYGASARAFTGPCSPGAPTAGEDLPIAIFPKFTRGRFPGLSLPAGRGASRNDSSTVPRGLDDSWQKGNSPTINVSFAGAQPYPARAFTQFYHHQFQQKFIGGKPCGRLHTN